MKLGVIILGVLSVMSIVNAEEFTVGQVWNYKTRPIEKNSVLTIVKIDNVKDIKIIHISLEGTKIKNTQAPSGFGDAVSHLPISEASLRNSVTKLLRSNVALPEYEKGYEIWKEAFEKGDGGYFTITVSECVEYMERTINQ